MIKKYIPYYVFTLLLIFTANPSFSQIHDGYCDGTKTTADVLDCVNKHKSDVQERMNSLFDRAKEMQDQKSFARLGAAQSAWLTYRDTQCAWEAGLAPNPSLKKIYEISCLTLLTNLRTDLLATTLETESNDRPREFGTTPRWVNVLIDDYPSVFWRFGHWAHADLDCDGMEEEVVAGVSFNDDSVYKDKISHKDKNTAVNIVVAVAENPLTGKPSVKTIDIPVKADSKEPEEGDVYLCGPSFGLSLTDYPKNNETSNVDGHEGIRKDLKNGEKNICRAIQIQAHQCKSVLLYWNGQEYVLQSQLVSDKHGL